MTLTAVRILHGDVEGPVVDVGVKVADYVDMVHPPQHRHLSQGLVQLPLRQTEDVDHFDHALLVVFPGLGHPGFPKSPRPQQRQELEVVRHVYSHVTALKVIRRSKFFFRERIYQFVLK